MQIGTRCLTLGLIFCTTLCKSEPQANFPPTQSLLDNLWTTAGFGRHLAKTEENTITCAIDSDCPEYPYHVCGIKTAGVCDHKAVFPVEPLEIGGIILFAVVMALSNIAGVGGGGVAIPIIMATFVFTTKPAIAISSFSIFLTTLGRFIMNFRERNPEKPNVVVIDYDLAMIMMPTTLAGAQVGAIILVTFPSMIIQIILTIMLAFLAIQSTFKAISITKKENQAKLAAVAPEPAQQPKQDNQKEGGHEVTPAVQMADLYPSTDSQPSSDENVSQKQQLKGEYCDILGISVTDTMDKKEISILRSSVKAESSHFQWVKQGICILMLSCLVLMNLMMGSSSRKSIIGIKKCDSAYWSIQIAFVILCAVAATIAVRMAQRNQKLKMEYGGINIGKSDIHYSDKKKLTQLLMLGFIGGWVAGALGLGGGSIYNPAFLSLGIPPKVSSATGLYLVTFSTFASVLVYFLNDQLNVLYGLWIGFWSCLGMVAGLILTQYYMKKTGRQSVIVWCLVVIFVISTFAIPIFGGLSLKKEADEGLDLMAFSSLCETKD